MIMVKSRQKRATIGVLEIAVGAIVILAIAGVILYIVPNYLFNTGEKNVKLLASCKTQGGICKPINCGTGESEFFRLGCPFDEDGNGKIDESEKKNEYCCIPKEKSLLT